MQLSKIESLQKLTRMSTGAFAQFLDPLHYEPVRLPDMTSVQLVGTAVCALSQTLQLKWTGDEDTNMANWSMVGPSRNLISDPSHRLLIKLRDPVVALIVSEFGPETLSTSTYAIGVSNVNNSDFTTDSPTLILGAEPVCIPLTGIFHSAGPYRYPDSTPAGWNTDKTQRVVWIDASTAKPTILRITGIANAYPVSITATAYTNEHCPSVYRSGTFVAGAATTMDLTVNRSGYYAFHVHNQPPDTVQGNTPFVITNFLALVTVTQWFSHYTHLSMIQALPSMDKVRVLGDALLCTNTSAEMYKSGTIYARQPQTSGPWLSEGTDLADFTASNVAEMYSGPLAKGLYAITKPQGEVPLQFNEATNISKDSYSLPGFMPLNNFGSVQVLLVPADVSAASPKTTVTLHFFRGLEFTTDSQMYVVKRCGVPRSALPMIFDALGKAQQFHENPLHLADIAKTLRSFGEWGWRNRSEISSIVKMIATLAGVAL